MGRRINLFEFEDLTWLPNCIRSGMTNYLRHLFHFTGVYQPSFKVIAAAATHQKVNRVLDLCSGGGGPAASFSKHLNNKNITLTLSDKFPNLSCFQYLANKENGNISFISKPVDAADVPLQYTGFRTLFSSFHHFDEEDAKLILGNAVKSRSGIAIMDGGRGSLFLMPLMILIHPLLIFLFTPFFKPLTLSQLFFTYVIPVIPFCVIWDGTVSFLRLYSPRQMLAMAHSLHAESYAWKAGIINTKWGLQMNYLVGYPV